MISREDVIITQAADRPKGEFYCTLRNIWMTFRFTIGGGTNQLTIKSDNEENAFVKLLSYIDRDFVYIDYDPNI